MELIEQVLPVVHKYCTTPDLLNMLINEHAITYCYGLQDLQSIRHMLIGVRNSRQIHS